MHLFFLLFIAVAEVDSLLKFRVTDALSVDLATDLGMLRTTMHTGLLFRNCLPIPIHGFFMRQIVIKPTERIKAGHKYWQVFC